MAKKKAKRAAKRKLVKKAGKKKAGKKKARKKKARKKAGNGWAACDAAEDKGDNGWPDE